MKNAIHDYLISLGFKEGTYFYSLKISMPKIKHIIYCNIDKDDLDIFNDSDTKDCKYAKQYIIQCINDTKSKLIKSYLEGQPVTEENINTLRNFIEAVGYIKKDNGVWEFPLSYKMQAKEYNDSAIIDEEDLKEMTLNDAMLRVMDAKRSKEAELEFQMKYDTESVNAFVEQFECPTCPK